MPQASPVSPRVWAVRGLNRTATNWLVADTSSTVATTVPEIAKLGSSSTDSATEGKSAKNTPTADHPRNPETAAILKLERVAAGTAGQVGLHRCRSCGRWTRSSPTAAVASPSTPSMMTKGAVVVAPENSATTPAMPGPAPVPATKATVARVDPNEGRDSGEASTS